MKGSFKFRVFSMNLAYEFTIRRNITFIQGDSGTGKSTLIDMLELRERDEFGSGVEIETEADWEVLTMTRWKDGVHEKWHGKVVFMDEGARFLSSGEFAKFVRDGGNYVVIVSREPHKELYSLPYSVKEIYKMRYEGGENHLVQLYEDGWFLPSRKPDVIVTEDRKSGYEFFRAVAEKIGAECIPSGGRENIKNVLMKNNHFLGKKVLVVADGAAFGSQVKFYFWLTQAYPNIQLWLPESFEYLILSSPMFTKKEDVRRMLAEPSTEISTDYFSWERYFTDCLTKITQNKPCNYDKSNLNQCYVEDCCCKKQNCDLYTEGNKQTLILGKQAMWFSEPSRLFLDLGL